MFGFNHIFIISRSAPLDNEEKLTKTLGIAEEYVCPPMRNRPALCYGHLNASERRLASQAMPNQARTAICPTMLG
ncbi:MAG: hypothetical protein DDG59_11315 [Anaerolineae bacterium]|nr:MAG: hypothetical protein DDG59_11315 [Anaerolineae bacterium]